MKLILICLLCSTFFGMAQSNGINFIQGKTWDELLAMAKATDKLLFVDAYAVWCAPCKLMDQQVFVDERVGTFYNENFICTKMDMEKGEGIDIAQRYKIQAFPSYLFVDGEGNLAQKSIGYQPIEAFISTGEKALDPNNQIGALQKAVCCW